VTDDRDILWRGQDTDGVECCISRRQWEVHVAKRPEIEDAFELTTRALIAAEFVELDKHRPVDEIGRRFRLLRISGQDQWARYFLVVSVKYVLQSDNQWIKFYQSCWYERKREGL